MKCSINYNINTTKQGLIHVWIHIVTNYIWSPNIKVLVYEAWKILELGVYCVPVLDTCRCLTPCNFFKLLLVSTCLCVSVSVSVLHKFNNFKFN
jgi:hypothetical protein